jgi:quinohemoprotein ethanol dehydrogenase
VLSPTIATLRFRGWTAERCIARATGEFAAYTADTGKKLWSIKTGSAIDATPVSFAVNGEQYIVVPVGWGSASRIFGPASMMATPESKRGPSRLLAWKLGSRTLFPYPSDTIPPVPKPPKQTFSRDVVEQGKILYETHLCSGCHSPGLDGSGAWTVNGAIPDLRYAPPEVHSQWYGIVLGGTHRDAGMLGFGTDLHFPNVKRLTSKEADAIHAYVIDGAWKAYNEQYRRLPPAARTAPNPPRTGEQARLSPASRDSTHSSRTENSSPANHQ